MFKPLKQLYNFIRKNEERQEQEDARFGKIFFGYVMIPIILGFCLLASNAFTQSTWTQKTASVVSTRIEDPPQKTGLYTLLVTYSYEVAGKTFRGSGPVTHNSKRATLEHKQEDEFPTGTNIQIACNPADMSESSLARGASGMPYFFLVAAALMTFVSYKLIRTKPLPSSLPSENY